MDFVHPVNETFTDVYGRLISNDPWPRELADLIIAKQRKLHEAGLIAKTNANLRVRNMAVLYSLLRLLDMEVAGPEPLQLFLNTIWLEHCPKLKELSLARGNPTWDGRIWPFL